MAAADRKVIVEADLAEEKLSQVRFKNEVEQNKYARIEAVQRELDGVLIRLQRNLLSLPESVADAVRVCRDRAEVLEIIEDALRQHMREVSNWKVVIENDSDAESDGVHTESEDDD